MTRHLGLIDATARRNAFGRQLQSFEADLAIEGIGDEPLRAVFIRAPWIERVGPGVDVLAEYDGHPVAIREGAVLACAFHPELTDDSADPRTVHGNHDEARNRARRGGEALRDPRAERLAKILVGYSTEGEGGRDRRDRRRDRRRAAAAGRLRGGAEGRRQPDHERRARGQTAAYYKHASDAQLDWVSPVAEWLLENADVRIAIGASTNTRELSASRPSARPAARRPSASCSHGRWSAAPKGEFRWVYTLFPTNAYAAEAEMSLVDYEDFYYGACLAADGDPLPPGSGPRRRPSGWPSGSRATRRSG